MSDAAFEDFTKQVLELSYEQTLTLMEKMQKSLVIKFLLWVFLIIHYLIKMERIMV